MAYRKINQTFDELQDILDAAESSRSKGSAIKPVYMDSDGVATPITHSIEADVPSSLGTSLSKVDGIETGAQVNILEGVKVNGTDQAIANKKVNISVPTKTSDIINDSGFLTQHQDISGKVDKVPGKGLSTNDFTNADKAQVDAVGDIQALIPTEATSGNKLADKAFVANAIATGSATYRGMVTAVDDTEAAAQTALATITTKDLNDTAIVKVADTPQAGVDKYKKYKYDGSGWSFEYVINNTSFTPAQWATINSGITSTDKTKLDNTAVDGDTVKIGGIVIGVQVAPIGYARNSQQANRAINDNDGNLITGTYATKSEVDSKYEKPGTGIPKADLESSVQTSLGKADTALQTHQDISGKADKSDTYTKTQVNTLVGNKVDKVAGKGLSTNDLTNRLLNVLECTTPPTSPTDGQVIHYLGQTTASLTHGYFYKYAVFTSYKWIGLGTPYYTKVNPDPLQETPVYSDVNCCVPVNAVLRSERVDTPYYRIHFAYEIEQVYLDSETDVSTATILDVQPHQDISGKVDKITGKGLSTNDYTSAEKTKLSGIESGAEVNIIKAIKRNGTALTPDASKAINVVVPTDADDITYDGSAASHTAGSTGAKLAQLDEEVGDLTDLTTTAKTNIVAAVNEVNGHIGDIQTFLTNY